MPDRAAHKIININIDLLDAEDTQKDNWNTNRDATKVSNAKQEIHGARCAMPQITDHTVDIQ